MGWPKLAALVFLFLLHPQHARQCGSDTLRVTRDLSFLRHVDVQRCTAMVKITERTFSHLFRMCVVGRHSSTSRSHVLRMGDEGSKKDGVAFVPREGGRESAASHDEELQRTCACMVDVCLMFRLGNPGYEFGEICVYKLIVSHLCRPM